MSQYLKANDVCQRYGFSTRTYHELTRHRRIPGRIIPGTRPWRHDENELDAWDAGDYDDLQVKDLPDGGVVVRLVLQRPSRLRRAA
jgi:predicted DNA-binding transcriptional regulator AlpA